MLLTKYFAIGRNKYIILKLTKNNTTLQHTKFLLAKVKKAQINNKDVQIMYR